MDTNLIDSCRELNGEANYDSEFYLKKLKAENSQMPNVDSEEAVIILNYNYFFCRKKLFSNLIINFLDFNGAINISKIL